TTDGNVGPIGVVAQSPDGTVVEVVLGAGDVLELVEVLDVLDVVGTCVEVLVELDVLLVVVCVVVDTMVVGTTVVDVVVVEVVVVGATNPRTTITRSPPPNVENRKSPVSGSTTAPSAPLRPVMKSRRDAAFGSPLPSMV